MAEIEWTAEAQAWLRDIYDYIAVDDRDAALRTVLGIFEKSQLLKDYPPQSGTNTKPTVLMMSAFFFMVITG